MPSACSHSRGRKEGLTLTVANHAVFYDRSFSLDDYLQAQDRIHRISQEKPCHVKNLVAAGTVDCWVDALLAAKHLAAQLGQGDITRGRIRQPCRLRVRRDGSRGTGTRWSGGTMTTRAATTKVEDTLLIRGVDIPVQNTTLSQSDLRFFVDNPRVYSDPPLGRRRAKPKRHRAQAA